MAAFSSTETKLEWKGFRLKNYDGSWFDSAALKDDIVCLCFTCNHCPYALAAWPTLIDLAQEFRDRVAFVAINSNNNPDYPDDRFEEMAPFVEQMGVNMPYLFDEDQSIARAYRAVCTPEPFLFVRGELFYHGRINDNWKEPEKVKEESLKLAIKAALGEGSLPESIHPSMGCSIKWVNP
ncbi:MAG: thioredoxin family protein [Spirochaetales bacterium]|nr:thioredoxin family protein [Spirochaetales bacterium]